MPLKIKLPPKERIIVNGAVLENGGEATTLIVHNRADILRRKEVLSEQDANTPARRVYYALQCAYLFEDQRDKYLEFFRQLLSDYLEAAPSAGPIAAEIEGLIVTEKYYEALRKSQSLVEHEKERFEAAGFKGEG